jgi:UPF0716 protein FxsA
MALQRHPGNSPPKGEPALPLAYNEDVAFLPVRRGVRLLRLFGFLIVLLVVIPTVELTLLLLFGQMTGSAIWPLALVIGTGVLGAALARWQGAGVYWRIHSELRAGKIPTTSLLDGFLILVAGILLITPGLLSDLIGVTLLIPPLRYLYRNFLMSWVQRYFQLPAFPLEGYAAGPGFNYGDGEPPYRSQVIESYVIEKTETSESLPPR